MRNQKRRDTAAELAIRRLSHARGMRYRVDAPLPLKESRRRADMLFANAKVAVFIDGCYWHACPIHATRPKANADWWADKLAMNVARDRNTDKRLAENGWTVVRIWEHENPEDATNRIAIAVAQSTSSR